MKKVIQEAAVHTVYYPKQQPIVSADASSYGLGAVLLQKDNDGRVKLRSCFCVGRTEKEAYAVTWACERFEKFLIGKKFHVQTDHRPPIPLLGVPSSQQEFRDSS